MIRPILDGVIVRMEPPSETTAGGLIIPGTALADVGTIRAKREAKIGRVLAVGPGRHYAKRLEPYRGEANKKRAPKHDTARLAAFIPMEVRVGDRVLFDPVAELREVDPHDPLVRSGAQYQIAAVLESDATWARMGDAIAAAATWGAVAVAAGVGASALKAGTDQ